MYSNSVLLANHCAHCDGRADFNYNNFTNTSTLYAYFAGGPYATSGELNNAENNYWGTSIESEIQETIFDWNDDGTYELDDYDP